MKKILLFILITLPTILCAQGEASNWYFGQNAGLQFDIGTGNVTAVTNGSLDTLEGCASISDINGNLLFYTDGITVWNRTHTIMTNGTGLNGDSSSTSSAIIVPKPQDPNIYYIFTVDEPHHNDGGINHGLNYTVVDMSDGIGFVDNAEKNVPLITYDTTDTQETRFKCSEKISAVKSSDCESFWVITHFIDDFYAFKVDNIGVDTTPVVSTTPTEIPISGYRRNALGYLKASPQGDKLAAAHLGLTTVEGGNGPGKVMLYDFDNSTGIVTNELELYNGDAPYGVEFSPQGTKLYATVGLGNSGTGNSLLLQYDLLSANIPASQFTVDNSSIYSAGAIQVGIDGKIYRALLDFGNINNSGRFLGVIENPEVDGASVIYNENGILVDITNTNTNLSRIGLPPFIQSLFATPVDIIRNGVSTTELSLCTTQSYSLIADDIPGAIYTWTYNGTPLAETSFQLNLTNVTLADAGLYQVEIDPNNGECPSFGEANVSIFELPVANPIDPQLICDDNNDGFWTLDLDALAATVLGGQDAMLFSVTFHPTQGDADSNTNALTTPYTNQTAYGLEPIFVRIENNNNTSCSDTTISFDFDVFDQPTANPVMNYELCDDTADGDDTNGFVTFDLSTINTEVLVGQDPMQFNITYHPNPADANDSMNVLSTTYVNTTPGGNPITARIENIDNPNCFDTVTFNVVVHPLPVVMQPVALLQCDDDTDGISDFNLTEANSLLSNDAANETFTYYTSLADAQNISNPIANETAYSSSNGGQVFVRVETVNDCFRTGEVNLIVGATQIPTTFGISYEVCDDTAVDGDNTNGIATFDFSDADTQINALFTAAGQNLTITYYENFTDALAEQNAIPDISNHRNDASPNVQNIVVRVDSDVNNACLGLGEHITLTVNPLPDLNTITDYVVCSDIANQFTFDLTIKDTEVINGQANVTVSYHESQADADADANAITSPYTTFPRTIFVRATNTITGCANTEMSFDLIINENPVANIPTDLIVCDEPPFDGFTTVDLTVKSTEIVGTQTDVSVQYFTNQADADNNTNALASPYANTSNPQTIFARVENGLTGCFSTTSFNIDVNDAPAANPATPLEYCDTDNDGIGIFNVRDSESEITGGVLPGQVTVTYHETPDDADSNVNALADVYSNITPYNQTLYVRVENVLTGCYNVVSLDLIVHDSPEIAALDAVSLSECDDDTNDQIAQFDLTLSELDILNGEDPTTHIVRYYNTQANAIAGTPTGEINNVNAYSNIPPSPQLIWVRVEDQVTGCFSITNLTLIVDVPPALTQLPNIELCDAITLGDGIEVFDLTALAEDLLNNATGISLDYYATLADLTSDTPITNPEAYANTIINVQTIWVRATDDSTGCQSTISFNISVNPLPSPTLDPNGMLLAETCDDDNDGFVATDLAALVAAIINNEPDVIYTFHETETDANNNINALSSPYTNIIMDSQTIYVLATNTVTGCFTVTPLQINIIPIPIVPIEIEDLEVCDAADSLDGIAMFDLTQTQAEIFAAQDTSNLTLTYHESEQDAIDDLSPIVNLTDYINITPNQQTIWVRLEDNTTACYAIGSFDLLVVPPPVIVTPQPFSLCDDLESGDESDEISTFDLTDKYDEITNGDTSLTLTYYASDADFAADIPIADPTAYQNTMNLQEIIIVATNAAGCTTDTRMLLRVLPIPTPNTTPTPLEACDDDTDGDATNGILIFDLTQAQAEIVNNEGNVTVSYHTTEVDAAANTNPIVDPTMFAVDMATANENGQVIIYVRVQSDIQIDSNMEPCYKVVELPVIVHPLPALTSMTFSYIFCEYDTDNVGQFIWDDVTASLDLLTAPQMLADFTVTYHPTAADALAGTAALVDGYENMGEPDTVFIRVENTATGCFNSNNIASVDLTVEPIPTATAPTTYQECATDESNQLIATFDLTSLDATIIGGQLNMEVSYYTTAVDAADDINAIVDPTMYINSEDVDSLMLFARVRQTITGCLSDPVMVSLQVNPLPVFTLPADDILCVDATTGTTDEGPMIGVDLGAGYTYLWNTPNGIENTPTVAVTTAGTYSLVITDGNFPETNCSYSDSVTYEASSAPATLDIQITTPAFADTHNVIATATGGSGIYEYQLDDGGWQGLGEFFDLTPGEHTVTVRDTNGCGELIRTFELIDYMEFFTPNGDEYNPTWNIIGLRNQPGAKIYIFDRYGKLLKQISPAGQGWDGTFNGSPMPSQDYWFRVEYVDPFDGTPKEFINHFTLKR
ncbi:hypothetical protein KORDIASMS9_02528 [Kordia sp. SMS9]|uniref:T9SS type B sorting domain-containing protein n=1 Tax=Kordia sp. SMS9 TaxID=2282170 RepID=UPI000E0DBEF8|nr:T9SS type B sorting domain-containing protein [Kordia sp. SMS9]AXG70289.1 hypothetical protein KORDIASMS9_02528 [Kordia sp. SMS9]